jgi:phosphatidylserine/phosphatidylglycerophosphate/cardiolipin synthase-like enzyme
MSFRLVDSGWQAVMDDALKTHHTELRLVCPFIKRRAAERLLAQGKPKTIRVITRFNLCDFYNGVSDTAALRLILENGAQIRGVQNLHAKLYLFDASRAIVTSANLTHAALNRNHEFGFSADDPAIIATCGAYFDNLWKQAGPNLTATRLTEWETRLSRALSGGSRPTPPAGLDDEGVEAGISPPAFPVPASISDASQWFVKFFWQKLQPR